MVNHKFAKDLAELGLDITGKQAASISNTAARINAIKTENFIYATYTATDSTNKEVAVIEVVRDQSKSNNPRLLGVCYTLSCTPEGDFKTENGTSIGEGNSRKVARRHMAKLKEFFEYKTW